MQTFNNEYTAVVKNEGDWWIGWIEEIPGVNCQERTHRELMESLHVTLIEALEFNRRDVLSASDKMNSINEPEGKKNNRSTPRSLPKKSRCGVFVGGGLWEDE